MTKDEAAELRKVVGTWYASCNRTINADCSQLCSAEERAKCSRLLDKLLELLRNADGSGADVPRPRRT